MSSIFPNATNIFKVVPFLMFFVCLSLLASEQGEGSVIIRGAVIYTPCSIDLDSRDQTIDMGHTPVLDIEKKGYGPSRAFSVRLVNCFIQPSKGHEKYDSEYYQITFEPIDGARRFTVHGDAEGVELSIRDTNGFVAEPGVAFPARMVTPGSMNLDYLLQLVSNGQPVIAGDYQSLIRFRMDYY